MKSNDNLEKTIRQKLSFSASDKLHDNILNDVLNAQEQSMKTQSAASRPNIRRIIMTSPVTKLATAAVIIIAAFIGISQLGPGTSVAWAEVAQKVNQIRSFTYHTQQSVSEVEGVTESSVCTSSDHGMKIETQQNGQTILISYILPQNSTMINVTPQWKKYQTIPLDTAEINQTLNQSNPKELVGEFMSIEYKKLGRDNIDGIEVEGIEVTNPKITDRMFQNAVGRLWVDVETELPVRIEIEGTTTAGSMTSKIVTDNIDWNVELTESTFKPNIPGDYIGVDENNVARLDGPRTHTFHDGSTVTLADGAKIQWLDNPDQRGFEHLAGAVDVTVTKGNREFVVTTPYGEVKALGTKFSLELVDGTDTNTREEIRLLAVEVEEGSVQVSNAKGSSVLKASRKLVVEPDQKPYDYYQDQNLPLRLRERINAAVEAMEAGDSKAYIANYNINYMYKLIKGQVEYDPNLFGGSKEDAERLQKMGQDINSPEELFDFFTAMGGIKKAKNKLYIRSVELNETGDHAVASCVERKGPKLSTITTPQWHYFDNDWWQIDD